MIEEITTVDLDVAKHPALVTSAICPAVYCLKSLTVKLLSKR